jgi:transcriptional regulator
MYVPEQFRAEDVESMHRLMRARPFATLVSAGASGLAASHLPTVLKEQAPLFGAIEFHLARANPHWKELDGEVLMIFHGAQGYITPRWYPSKVAHGKVVPTWNYAVVHAYGRPHRQDGEWLRSHVAELSDQQERGAAAPWAIADAPARYVETMLRGIVGFRLEITRLEGKWKMSQNREDVDRAGVVQGLRERGRTDDLEISALVEAGRKPGSQN